MPIEHRFAGLVVVVVKLCDLIDEAERELFAVEIAVGQRSVDAVHGVDESLLVLEHFVLIHDARGVDVEKIARHEARGERSAERSTVRFFIGQRFTVSDAWKTRAKG